MSELGLISELEGLISEGRNSTTMDLDLLSTQEILEKINHEDAGRWGGALEDPRPPPPRALPDRPPPCTH